MEIVKLGEVFDFSIGTSSLPKDYKNGNDTLFINYKDVFEAKPIFHQTLSRIKVLNNKDYSNKMVFKNDLVITSSSETSKDNGMVSIYEDNIPALLNGFCKKMVIKNEFSNKILSKYIFYLLNTSKYRKHISNCSNGITRHNIIWNFFYKIEIKIIPLKDQQDIIDIIKPCEKLFLKFKNLIRIDTIENCKYDLSILIDIIEPFELELLIREKMNDKLLSLLKSLGNISDSGNFISLGELVNQTRDKNTSLGSQVIELSSINSDSLTLYKFKNTKDFVSNIFSTQESDIFLSSIRPALKKYGISSENMNILGTLFNLRPKIYSNRGFILSCISSENFQNFLIQSSEGTKMPVIKWNKFKGYIFQKVNSEQEIILNNIFDCLKLNNLLLKSLNEILTNLFELYIK